MAEETTVKPAEATPEQAEQVAEQAQQAAVKEAKRQGMSEQEAEMVGEITARKIFTLFEQAGAFKKEEPPPPPKPREEEPEQQDATPRKRKFAHRYLGEA